jgi:hypothetical protein
MHVMDVTSLILVVLALFIGLMMWGIRDALESSLEYQEEILAELVYAKFRPGDRRRITRETSPAEDEGEVLVAHANEA